MEVNRLLGWIVRFVWGPTRSPTRDGHSVYPPIFRQFADTDCLSGSIGDEPKEG